MVAGRGLEPYQASNRNRWKSQLSVASLPRFEPTTGGSLLQNESLGTQWTRNQT